MKLITSKHFFAEKTENRERVTFIRIKMSHEECRVPSRIIHGFWNPRCKKSRDRDGCAIIAPKITALITSDGFQPLIIFRVIFSRKDTRNKAAEPL